MQLESMISVLSVNMMMSSKKQNETGKKSIWQGFMEYVLRRTFNCLKDTPTGNSKVAEFCSATK